MNQIDDYLKREHQFLNLIDDEKEDAKSNEEIRLKYFFNIFIELEKKYAHKIEELKRLESEHKTEINNVPSYIFYFEPFKKISFEE
jgi:hypothetical protein